MGTIRTEQLAEHIWLLDEKGETSGYVVTGTEKALVIDTMNGTEDVKAVVRTITDLPLMLVNTHSHPDHIGGNHFFESCYMHPDDVEFVKMFTAPEIYASFPEINPIKEGDIIDLGGLHVEIYDLPGHTPGSICLLLVEDRVLFTGDAINRHLWMQLDGCIPLSEYIVKLERLDALKERADRILHGHTRKFDSISLLSELENGIKELVNQQGTEITDKDPDYNWFGGVSKMHPFDDKGSVVCYSASNIK